MYHSLRRARRAALALLISGLAASPALSQPLPLTPVFSPPPHFDTVLAAAPDALSAPPSLNVLLAPPTEDISSLTTVPRGASSGAPDLLPSLSATWASLWQSDPSLQLVDWRQVFNVTRLGVFAVPLRDDPAERANILLAAQAVNGVTIAPGETFSFNKTVGERTPERGYQDGLMFSDGQVVRGTGGGICLVATGLYNAALQAGLELLERHAHSGVVGYAPPGCDASIVYGSEDMQFRNTTGAPLVVETHLQDEQIIVGLFGRTPPPGLHVFVKDTRLDFIHAPLVQQPDPTLPPDAAPVVVQKPHLGYDVTVERVWTRGRHVLRRETVVSEHRAPRAKIVHVPVPLPVSPEGPGAAAQTPDGAAVAPSTVSDKAAGPQTAVNGRNTSQLQGDGSGDGTSTP